MRRLSFLIKKGIYCSWCAELMEHTLRQNFSVKELVIDVPENKVHLTTWKRVDPKRVISLLKKRGYCLREEK